MPESDVQKQSENIKRNMLIIALLILLLILIIYGIIYKMGKIGHEVSSNEISQIEITQNNINWENIEDLDIFNNPQFNNEKIIIPMSKGSYEFEIHNKLDSRISYSIYMEEINELNVNMKYKLKLDNVYVIGNENTYVDIEELKLEKIIVPENSSNIYTLEWYWDEAENDTEIGKKVYAEYKCKIRVIPELYTLNQRW